MAQPLQWTPEQNSAPRCYRAELGFTEKGEGRPPRFLEDKGTTFYRFTQIKNIQLYTTVLKCA